MGLPDEKLTSALDLTFSHAKDYAPVNLDKIQHWIDRGLLDPSQPIDASGLLHSRCIHQVKDGVKVLGDGAEYFRTPITLIVSRASQSAIRAIEKVGGNVECRYYTNLGLRALVKPHKWAEKGKPLPRDAMPIKKKDLSECPSKIPGSWSMPDFPSSLFSSVYYASPNNRGYLAKRAIAATILDSADKAAASKSKGASDSATSPEGTGSAGPATPPASP
jgi:large subunit ribosomal protein L15